MFSTTKLALAAAIVLCIACPASAATRHHGVKALYNVVAMGGGSCSPVHAPLCSNICAGAGPCAPPDTW